MQPTTQGQILWNCIVNDSSPSHLDSENEGKTINYSYIMLKLSLRHMDSNMVSYRKTGLQRGWSNRSYWWIILPSTFEQFHLFLPPSQAEQHSILSGNKEVPRVAQVHSTSGINPPKFLFLWSHCNWKLFTGEYCQSLMQVIIFLSKTVSHHQKPLWSFILYKPFR